MSGFSFQVNLLAVVFVTEVATLSYLSTWHTKVRIMYVLIIACDRCVNKNWAQMRFILHLLNSINLNPFLKPQYIVSSCIKIQRGVNTSK